MDHRIFFSLTLLTSLLLLQTGQGHELVDVRASESCSDGDNALIGIRPDQIYRLCDIFWLCRIKPDPVTAIETKYFNCSDADPTKPFYDAKLCQCVETDTHCGENVAHRNDCVRRFDPTETVESCKGYGESLDYYENIFPNYDDPTKFWSCGPWENSTMNVTYSQSFNCSGDTVYNAKNCSCAHPGDEDVSHDPFNIHPMNRFLCATPYTRRPDENCQDPEGNYYEGLFSSHKDHNDYWECIGKNDSTPESVPYLRSCPDPTLVFNIHTCNCTTDLPPDYQDSQNRYNCAKLLENPGDQVSCKDENGKYHLGDIPNRKDCSKFWSCQLSENPSEPTKPTPKSCYPGTYFNVHSSFCGCDHPNNFDCQDNLDPGDQFLCAPTTV